MANSSVTVYRHNENTRSLISSGVWIYEIHDDAPLQLATIAGFEGIKYDEDLILPAWMVMA